jgi:hypothetical protein
LAAELVRLDIALLVAAGAEPAARAARQAAGSSLPIIMVAIDYDPIALGYVTSLARPAGNITGVVGQQIELTRKRVELLKEALPRASRVAILWEAASEDQFKAAHAADPARSTVWSTNASAPRAPPDPMPHPRDRKNWTTAATCGAAESGNTRAPTTATNRCAAMMCLPGVEPAPTPAPCEPRPQAPFS